MPDPTVDVPESDVAPNAREEVRSVQDGPDEGRTSTGIATDELKDATTGSE